MNSDDLLRRLECSVVHGGDETMDAVRAVIAENAELRAEVAFIRNRLIEQGDRHREASARWAGTYVEEGSLRRRLADTEAELAELRAENERLQRFGEAAMQGAEVEQAIIARLRAELAEVRGGPMTEALPVMCECGAPVDEHGSEWDDCPGPVSQPEPPKDS